MGFFGFVSRNLFAAILFALAVATAVLSYAEQADAIVTAFEPWQYQALGAILFMVAVFKVLYDFEQRLPSGGAAKPKVELVADRVNQAARNAGFALGTGQLKALELAAPEVDSAVALTAKFFRLPRPILPDDPAKAVEVGSKYLAAVSPYAFTGNRADALKRAESFVRDHGEHPRQLRLIDRLLLRHLL